jgi:transcriptional regulator with XRE-family HTH domain
MTGADIKKLRDGLGCSMGDLAKAVGVDVRTVVAWESGDLFPTKRHSAKLEALRRAGPEAARAKKTAPSGTALLDEPRLWTVFRKLLAHPELFAKVEELAEKYPNPT